jgi:hypothetical protein
MVGLLRRDIDQHKPLLPHCIRQSFIARDRLQRCGAAFGGNKGRGELERIGRDGGGSLRRGRMKPSRSKRDSLPRWAYSALPVTGSSRATGRPRSTMSTGEPASRPSISALRLFLASVMVAIFTWPKQLISPG